MTIPTDLMTNISNAKDSIRNDPQNRLALAMRQRIWKAMGPDTRLGVGHKRRTRLAILCTQKVLALWHNKFAENDGPDIMLSIAEKFIEQQIDKKEATKIHDNFLTEVANMPKKYDGHLDFRPSMVGDAAVSALTTALVDCEFKQISDDIDDFDNDPETWECSVLASMAYANDQPALGLFEADKMYEFWNWYLDEAVPQAYQAYPD